MVRTVGISCLPTKKGYIDKCEGSTKMEFNLGDFSDPDYEPPVLCDPVTKRLLDVANGIVRVKGLDHAYCFDRSTFEKICEMNGGAFVDPLTRKRIARPETENPEDMIANVDKFIDLKEKIGKDLKGERLYFHFVSFSSDCE